VTDAARAREAAKFSRAEAARRLGVSDDYLARCEASGFPFNLASQASRLYKAPLGAFLQKKP
jgi:hypothetical protein